MIFHVYRDNWILPKGVFQKRVENITVKYMNRGTEES